MARNRKDDAESESLESSPSDVEDVVGEEEADSESEEENAPNPLFSKKVEISEKPSESLISGEDPEDEEDEGKSEDEEDDEAPLPIEPENTPFATHPAKSKAASKRAASESENVGDRDDAKRAKKNNEEGTKKSTFQRVFSEDDEIVILEGLIEYNAKTWVDPGSNMNGFREFVNKSLPFEATKLQLYEKIRRLRKRYENNSKKGRSTFNTTHEKTIFELSKKIWGTGEANNAVEVRNSEVGDAKTKGMKTEISYRKAGVSALDACLRDVNMSAEEMVIKHGLDIVDEAKKIELQEEWKQYRIEEIKLHLKKLKLLTKQGKLVLKSMESTD